MSQQVTVRNTPLKVKVHLGLQGTQGRRYYHTYCTGRHGSSESALRSRNIDFNSRITTRINNFTTSNTSDGAHVALAGGSGRATGEVREHHGAWIRLGKILCFVANKNAATDVTPQQTKTNKRTAHRLEDAHARPWTTTWL